MLKALGLRVIGSAVPGRPLVVCVLVPSALEFYAGAIWSGTGTLMFTGASALSPVHELPVVGAVEATAFIQRGVSVAPPQRDASADQLTNVLSAGLGTSPYDDHAISEGEDVMLRVAIVTGSTRPGRHNEAVSRWVYALAKERKYADFELVDIADYDLPLLDERTPPSLGRYTHEHTKRWADKIRSFDAYVFVTPEYNHSTSGALKNAIDYLYQEWNHKAAAFVSYGSAGGVRAVEHLWLIMAEVMVAAVRGQVMFSLFTDFETFTTFKPDPRHEQEGHTMFDQVILWAGR